MTDSTRKISKKQLIALRGAKCEICGITEWCNKPITFDDHHCDRNRKNGKETNRKIICPNCHRQQHLERSEEIKQKISVSMLGVSKSEEHRQAISISTTGIAKSAEAIRKMRATLSDGRMKGLMKGEKNGMYGKVPWNKGVPASEEHKEKNRVGHLGKEPWNKGKKTKKENAL